MVNKSQFLYRGVSESYHLSSKGFLRPKVRGLFTYEFHHDEPGNDWDGGRTYDSTQANAVIRHQLNQEGFPTSGISTTPHIDRAIIYARGKDGKSSGYVFKILRSNLEINGITEFVVAQYCRRPSVPEDDEVILVVSEGLHLPSIVVVETIPIIGIEAGI